MISDPIHIKFENQSSPNASFEIVKLEELIQRTYVDHSPFKLHKVDFYIVILISDGESMHTVDFTDYHLQKGSILTIRKGQIQKFFQTTKVKGSLLLFTDSFLVSYLEKLEAQKSLQLFNELLGAPKIQLDTNEYSITKKIIDRIENEYTEEKDDYSLGIIRSELHILITKLFRIKSDKIPTVSSRKYLQEFIQLQNLVELNAHKTSRVKDYAIMLAMSTKTLNNICKAIINKTAKEFIDDIHIKQIKRLLINTPLPIKEIAYASGFEETTNFYKYFKRQVKMTPEQFRVNF